MPDWSKTSRKIVSETLKGSEGLSTKEKRKLLFDAYPFGPREYWPYKAWCKAVRDALEIKPKKKITEDEPTNQIDLF